MNDCLFCKIIAGEIPSHKVLENKRSLAFLDIYPLTEGMTLVIPKKHVEDWWEMDEENLCTLMGDAQRVAKLLKKKFSDKRIGVHIEGLDVPHVHIKLFPFSTPTEFRAWPNHHKEPDNEKLRLIVESITA